MSGLSEAFRQELVETRNQHAWSQTELGQKLGLPQAHISRIEAGKVMPRFDTLLDLVRVLDRDLLMVPRALVPVVQALIRDYRHPDQKADDGEGERPLYAVDEPR